MQRQQVESDERVCDTMKDYIDAMNTLNQGDTICFSEKLWNEVFKSQPECIKREDSIISAYNFITGNADY